MLKLLWKDVTELSRHCPESQMIPNKTPVSGLGAVRAVRPLTSWTVVDGLVVSSEWTVQIEH